MGSSLFIKDLLSEIFLANICKIRLADIVAGQIRFMSALDITDSDGDDEDPE